MGYTLAKIFPGGEKGVRQEWQPVPVKCFSGHTYAERPDSFLWQGREHRVREVEKAWREPGARHFRVRTEDEGCFELRYQEAQDQWWLILQAGTIP